MQLLKIVTLRDEFYSDNANLVEALHTGPNGDIALGKTRGYGVLTVRLHNGLLFGIPLRSNVTHKHAFITVASKGLDFSKAVLIEDPDYVSNNSFEIPKAEFVKIADRELFIRERFEKYVKRYIKAVSSGDPNVLRDYRFSTLQNYHAQLGI